MLGRVHILSVCCVYNISHAVCCGVLYESIMSIETLNAFCISQVTLRLLEIVLDNTGSIRSVWLQDVSQPPLPVS